LIKILIVNYDLIMPNTGCVVSNFTKERKIYEHVWTYFVYHYILVSPELLRTATSLFLFSVLVSWNLEMR